MFVRIARSISVSDCLTKTLESFQEYYVQGRADLHSDRMQLSAKRNIAFNLHISAGLDSKISANHYVASHNTVSLNPAIKELVTSRTPA